MSPLSPTSNDIDTPHFQTHPYDHFIVLYIFPMSLMVMENNLSIPFCVGVRRLALVEPQVDSVVAASASRL